MIVDLASFTPVRSLAGGLLIGAASALLYAGNGRIAGVTGIAAGLLPGAARDERGWRIAFALGLIAASVVFALLVPGAFSQPSVGLPMVLLAGLLVGVGTRLSNGCTSGHGVCGLSRRSPRSLAAVATFMVSAGLTVAFTSSNAAALR